MSWDTATENLGYWLEVASNRMARRALHAEAKSLSKMSEDDSIQEWIEFLSPKGLTKSLRRDLGTILAKAAYDKATTSKKKDKVYPEDI